jgi:hypothetical protein
MFILSSRWTEPCRGSAAWTADLTETEAQEVQDVLDWLEEHARQDYGRTLMEWELHPSKTKGRADLESLEAVLDEIALNSRYNETGIPGDFYGATHPDLDGRS